MLLSLLRQPNPMHALRHNKQLQKIINLLQHNPKRALPVHFPNQMRADQKKQIQIPQLLQNLDQAKPGYQLDIVRAFVQFVLVVFYVVVGVLALAVVDVECGELGEVAGD